MGHCKILSTTTSKSPTTKTPCQEKVFSPFFVSMAKSRIPLVNGAIVSVLAKNAHLSVQLQSKFLNANAWIKLEGAVALWLDNFSI